MIRFTFFALLAIVFFSCASEEKKDKEVTPPFSYESFKDSVIKNSVPDTVPLVNILDAPGYTPGKDSLVPLLVKLDTQWKKEIMLMERYDTLKSKLKKDAGYSDEEKLLIKENIRAVDSFLHSRKNSDTAAKATCKEMECMLYVQVDKKKQKLYIWLLGELKDSFLVSTGKGKDYETPTLNQHPDGPVVTKYTSKKYPGGNYKGLGNMPYAVFISNGYAIHGTTPGNFSKLGSRASHGCVRLHPDNAKVFNALVKTIGITQTWVSIKDSL